jgi:putative spermidine/putrescine transport system substrate-binding protein
MADPEHDPRSPGTTLSRRQLLERLAGFTAALAIAPVAAACSAGAPGAGAPSANTAPGTTTQGGGVVRLMINGGDTEAAARKAILNDFPKQTGIDVQVIPALSAEMLTRVRAEKGNPTVDAVFWDDIVAVGARKEGLAEAIDPANVPNMKDLDPKALYGDGFGPAVYANVQVFAWNPENYKGPIPKAITDLWDPQYKDSLVVASTDTSSGILFLVESSLLWGGSYENMDVGFQKLKEIKPNVAKFYHQVAEVTPALTSDPVIVLGGSSAAHALQLQGQKIQLGVPTGGAWVFPACFDVVKGSPNKAAAEKLLNGFLDPKVQAVLAQQTYWAIYNQKAELDADTKANVPTQLNVWDPVKITQNREAWVERWKREVGG